MKSCNQVISANQIIKRGCGLLVIALFLSLEGNLQAVTLDDLPTRADALMKRAVERDRFSGSVLIAQEGKVLFEKGYGLANREWDSLNSPRTKFRIASLTKQFTAAAILLLQEQGKLKVTDAIARYVAGLPAEWQPITLHQLLTHTAGLPEYSPLVLTTCNVTRHITGLM